MNKLSKLQIWLHGISALSMAVFVYLFVNNNSEAFTRVPVIGILGGTYVALFLAANPGLLGGRHHLLPPKVTRLFYLVTALGLPILFFNATVWDYYQPISLYDDAIYALAGSWLLLIVSSLIALIKGQEQFFPAAIVALLGVVFVLFVDLVSNPMPSAALELHEDVFVGGEEGYDTYRIPGLLVLPAGAQLANGEVLERDRVLALAEARLKGDLDTGPIDLVQRWSEDAGSSWSEQEVICTHQRDGERGKCGNATPVFDAQTGAVWLAYNLSGIPGNLREGRRSHSAHLMRSDDGGLTWQEAANLPFANAVFGPGHGIQKIQEPHAGRLILPTNDAGTSFILFSDDNGASWQRGSNLGDGNENEIAELSDGSLYMAVRHNARVGRPPEPNGRLYAFSDDGGESWSAPKLDTALPTPVCQASVLRYGEEGGLLFSNPATTKARANMTVRFSPNDGKNWRRAMEVYSGPAGYSQLGALSDGTVVLLYERGDMEYSEMISFARIGVSDYLPEG